MRYMMLVTSLICALIAQIGFGADADHADYLQQVHDLFRTLTIELEKNLYETRTRDILDDAPVDDSRWQDASDTIAAIYRNRPKGTDAVFWGTAAKSVIKTALRYETHRYDGVRYIDKSAVLETLQKEFPSTAKHTVDGWLYPKYNGKHMRVISYTSWTSLSIDLCKHFQRHGVPQSRVATAWLNALRFELELRSREDVNYIVQDPFLKTVIATMKSVEKTGRWPWEPADEETSGESL